MGWIGDQIDSVKSMQVRQLITQAISLGMIVTSALIIWKGLMCITGSESPVVVVLSGSMEPGFKRGDILFLHMSKEPIRAGEIVVFNVDGREISIVHRVIKNLFLYGFGAIFNFLGILGTVVFKGPESFDILQGHSKATMFFIINNAGQGILSSFFFKYADTILKKYSSTVATIFTGFASVALFGHTLTINFMLGISIVFISMHQFFSPLSKVKEEEEGMLELEPIQNKERGGKVVGLGNGSK